MKTLLLAVSTIMPYPCGDSDAYVIDLKKSGRSILKLQDVRSDSKADSKLKQSDESEDDTTNIHRLNQRTRGSDKTSATREIINDA